MLKFYYHNYINFLIILQGNTYDLFSRRLPCNLHIRILKNPIVLIDSEAAIWTMIQLLL